MAGLFFSIGADFDKLRQLKEEIERLKNLLLSMDKAVDPKGFKALNDKLLEVTKESQKLEQQLAPVIHQFEALEKQGMETFQKIESALNASSFEDKITLTKEVIADLEQQYQRTKDILSQADFGEDDATYFANLEQTKQHLERINVALEDQRTNLGIWEAAYKQASQEVSQELETVTNTLSSGQASKYLQEDIGNIRTTFGELKDELAKIEGAYAKAMQTDKVEDQIQAVRNYQKQIISLKRSLEALYKYISAESRGDTAFTDDLSSIKKVMSEITMEVSIGNDMVTEISSNAKTGLTSIYTQLRLIREEMIQLELQGQKETPRYKQLQAELIKTGTAYRKVQQEQKLLTAQGSAQLSGLVSGMSAISGIASASKGFMSMFIKDQEKLIGIQTGLQGAMATTIGLQQVANVLHPTSAFRIQTVAKATALWNNTIRLLNVQLGINKALSKGLAGILIGVVLAAITAIVLKYRQWRKEQEELYKTTTAFHGELAKEQRYLRDIFNAYKDTNPQTEEHRKIKKAILDKYGDYIKHLIDENGRITDQAEAYAIINNHLRERIALKIRDQALDTAYEKRINTATSGVDKMMKYVTKEVSDLKKQGEIRKFLNEAVNASFGANPDEMKDLYSEISRRLNFDHAITNIWKGTGENLGAALYKTRDEIKAINKEVSDTDARYDGFINKMLQVDQFIGTDETKSKTSEDINKLKQNYADDQLKLANQQINANLEEQRIALDNEQKLLSIREDGFEKQKAQADLNHKKELLSIAKRAQELIEKQQEIERQKWNRENPKGTSTPFVPNTFKISDLSESSQTELIVADIVALENYEKETEQVLQNILAKYQDFNAKRININKAFDAEENALNALKTEDNSAEIDAALAILAQKRKEAIQKINAEEAEGFMQSTNLFVELFEDASRKTVGEITSIIDKAEELKAVLKDSDQDIPEWFIDSKIKDKDSLSPEQLDAQREAVRRYIDELRADPKVIQALEDALASLYERLGQNSPFIKFKQNIDKAFKGLKGEGKKDIGGALQGIGKAFQEIMPHLEQFGSDMGAIFGEETGQDISNTLNAIGSVAEVGMGVGKVMSGDPSGILDAASGAAKLFGHSKKINKEHKEALRLLKEQSKEQEHAYQIATLRQKLEYKVGETIYGSDKWGKASNASRVYKDSLDQLQKSMRELSTIEVKSGSRKSGWGPWKKRKDVYTNILQMYPKLIDSEGKIDKAMAESILATRTMKDEHKSALQMIIDNAELIETAYTEMSSYLTGVFGEIGDSIMKAFVDGFKGGKDAMLDFKKDTGKMFESLIVDFIHSMRIAPLLEQANKTAMDVISNTRMGEEEKNKKLLQITEGLIDKLINTGDAVNRDLAHYQKYMQEKHGIELFKQDEYKQNASSRSLEGISQDLGMELNGRMTDIQQSTRGIYDYLSKPIEVDPAVQSLLKQNIELNDIAREGLQALEEVRNIQLNAYYELKDINQNTKELYPIRQTLRKINTKLESL